MSQTIAEQLQIKPNTTVWVSDPAHIALLTPMPHGVRESDHLATASTAVLFAEDAAEARALLEKHAAEAAKPATFWIACATGGLDRDALQPIITEFRMRPAGEVAIGDAWSALRLETDQPLSDPAPSPR